MYKIKKYFQGVIKQGKMVRWPTGKELVGYFAVVVSVVVFSAVACSIDDYIIAQILGVLDRNLISSSSSSSSEAFRLISLLLGVGYGK
ncbi:preprotein translocase SecE subunit [Firmicutes bacterium CAG:449]|nr:preprotein translocase SecE subunit [Firmicutes bacterium CAG:449]